MTLTEVSLCSEQCSVKFRFLNTFFQYIPNRTGQFSAHQHPVLYYDCNWQGAYWKPQTVVITMFQTMFVKVWRHRRQCNCGWYIERHAPVPSNQFQLILNLLDLVYLIAHSFASIFSKKKMFVTIMLIVAALVNGEHRFSGTVCASIIALICIQIKLSAQSGSWLTSVSW